jgi:hypothetical protein
VKAGVVLCCVLAAGAATGVGLGSGRAMCTFVEKSQREAAAAAYAKRMPAARAAYFKKHASAKARAAFVARQRAALAALRAAAACDDSAASSGTGASGPVAAPPPSANEHFFFTDEIQQSARDEVEQDLAYAGQDEQTLLGVQLNEVNVFGSSSALWLAEQECGFYGYVGTCVAQKQASYATGAAEGGDRAIFLNWGTGAWNASQSSEKQKTIAHELFHVFQYQLDGLVADGSTPSNQIRVAGPIWIHEGAPEMVGYRVLADRHLINFSTYADLLAGEKTRAKAATAPLDQLLTVDQSNAAGSPYPLYMVAIDHLVSLAPNGIRSLTTYYQGLGQGMTWQASFQQAFGMSVDAFYANFASYRSHF